MGRAGSRLALTAAVRLSSGACRALLPRLALSPCLWPRDPGTHCFLPPLQEEEDRPVPEGRRGNQAEDADPVHRALAPGTESTPRRGAAVCSG